MKFISKHPKPKYTIISSYKKVEAGVSQFVPGKMIRFRNFEYDTKDKQEIDFLLGHPDFGFQYWRAKDRTEPTEEGKAQEEVVKKAKSLANTSCPFCSFKAKSEFGLKSHIRFKHAKQE